MRFVVAVVLLAGCRVAFDPVADSAVGDRYAAAVLSDGPVAYWRFGEGSGTVARDEVGAHPAAYQGQCKLGVTGALTTADTAVELDGVSCRIDAGDVFAFDGVAPFTIELWAKIVFADGNTRFLFNRETTDGSMRNGYQLPFQTSVLWFEKLVGNVGDGYVAAGPPVLARFEMIVVTFDGTIERVYRDGAEVATATPLLTTTPTTGRLVFGDTVENVTNKFLGTLDEIAFYDHALSASQVAAHFAAR